MRATGTPPLSNANAVDAPPSEETGSLGGTQEDLLLEMAVKSQERGRRERQQVMGNALARGDVHRAVLHMQSAPLDEARENNLVDILLKNASKKTQQALEAMKGGS